MADKGALEQVVEVFLLKVDSRELKARDDGRDAKDPRVESESTDLLEVSTEKAESFLVLRENRRILWEQLTESKGCWSGVVFEGEAGK